MKLIKLLALTAIVAVFAIPAIAQADQCNDENKAAWYKTFFDNYKGETPAQNQKVAYDSAKKYLGACPDDPNDVQAAFMKKFVKRMDERDQKVAAAKACDDAVKNKKYADEMKYCKDVLANDPDNVDINSILGIVGLSEGTLLNESANYARKAIQLIESGKPLKAYSHDQALAYLNWTIGRSQLTTAPAGALKSLLAAAKLESEVKKTSQLYVDINGAYEVGPRKTLSEEYKAKTTGGTETPESKLVLENLNQVIDRQIDALARAAATATDATKKKEALDALTELYKFRNKGATDANVNELVASVMTKPIPDIPTPITSLPTPTPAATPATTSGTSANGSSTSTTTTNGGAKPTGNANGGSKTGNATNGTTAPNGSKRPHQNHRRG